MARSTLTARRAGCETGGRALAHASCTPSGYSRPPRSVNGNTLVFDGQKVMRYNASTLPGLPQLPPGTVEWSHGPASADGFDGYLTLAGSLPHCTKEAEAIALVAHCTATLPAGSPV